MGDVLSPSAFHGQTSVEFLGGGAINPMQGKIIPEIYHIGDGLGLPRGKRKSFTRAFTCPSIVSRNPLLPCGSFHALTLTAEAVSAFPNAYLEVDEPPKRIPREKIFALVALVGISYLGLTTLILHFEPTGYDPIRQVVSDYAVGGFAAEMALGFFAGGAGLVALALAIPLANPGRTFRLGSSLLLLAGVCLFAVGLFPTDLEGATTTLHGTIHSILSQFVFIFGPVGMLLISYGMGRRSFWPSLLAFVTAGSFFAADMALSVHATGLVERIFILALLSWQFTVSLRLLKGS